MQLLTQEVWSRSQVSALLTRAQIVAWDFPGKNTAVGFLLQGIFLAQGLNPGLLPCKEFFTD